MRKRACSIGIKGLLPLALTLRPRSDRQLALRPTDLPLELPHPHRVGIGGEPERAEPGRLERGQVRLLAFAPRTLHGRARPGPGLPPVAHAPHAGEEDAREDCDQDRGAPGRSPERLRDVRRVHDGSEYTARRVPRVRGPPGRRSCGGGGVTSGRAVVAGSRGGRRNRPPGFRRAGVAWQVRGGDPPPWPRNGDCGGAGPHRRARRAARARRRAAHPLRGRRRHLARGRGREPARSRVGPRCQRKGHRMGPRRQALCGGEPRWGPLPDRRRDPGRQAHGDRRRTLGREPVRPLDGVVTEWPLPGLRVRVQDDRPGERPSDRPPHELRVQSHTCGTDGTSMSPGRRTAVPWRSSR